MLSVALSASLESAGSAFARVRRFLSCHSRLPLKQNRHIEVFAVTECPAIAWRLATQGHHLAGSLADSTERRSVVEPVSVSAVVLSGPVGPPSPSLLMCKGIALLPF